MSVLFRIASPLLLVLCATLSVSYEISAEALTISSNEHGRRGAVLHQLKGVVLNARGAGVGCIEPASEQRRWRPVFVTPRGVAVPLRRLIQTRVNKRLNRMQNRGIVLTPAVQLRVRQGVRRGVLQQLGFRHWRGLCNVFSNTPELLDPAAAPGDSPLLPTEPSTGISCYQADLNSDGIVNTADLLLLLRNWGSTNPDPPAADINGDGIVDTQDLSILLFLWGPVSPCDDQDPADPEDDQPGDDIDDPISDDPPSDNDPDDPGDDDKDPGGDTNNPDNNESGPVYGDGIFFDDFTLDIFENPSINPDLIDGVEWDGSEGYFPTGSGSNGTPPSSPGLYSLFEMDSLSAGTVPDALGNNPGSCTQCPSVDTLNAKLGDASYHFSGNQGVSLGSVDLSGEELTVLAWIYRQPGAEQWARIISQATGTHENTHYVMLSLDGTQLRGRLKVNGQTHTVSGGYIPASQWTQVAMTYDGAHARLFVDATPVASAHHPGSITAPGTAQTTIGVNPDNSNYFTGNIDELGIWKRALSVQEIEQLYQMHSSSVSASFVSEIIPTAGPFYSLTSSFEADSTGVHLDISTDGGVTFCNVANEGALGAPCLSDSAEDFIYRIRYTNAALLDWVQIEWDDTPPPPLPTAAFSTTPPFGSAPLNVALDASASSTPEGTHITAYLWKVDGTTIGTGSSISYTFNEPGEYSVTLTVTNNQGYEDSSSKSINVYSTIPGGGDNCDPDATVIHDITGTELDGCGWTRFEASLDTQVVFVAPDGNDGSCQSYHAQSIGMTTPDDLPSVNIIPCQSAQVAYSKLRNGFDDWMLFRRGDTFAGAGLTLNKSGSSKHRPFLIGSYGPVPQRPTLLFSLLVMQGGANPPNINNIAIAGLRFYSPTRDPENASFSLAPTSAAITWRQGGTGHLIEDCHFDYSGLDIQGYVGPLDSFVIRRSIVERAYSTNSHAQGIFTLNIHGLVIEESNFYHNGWNDVAGTFKGNFFGVGNNNLHAWKNITAGRFAIRRQWNSGGQTMTATYDIDQINLSGAQSMQEVVEIIANRAKQVLSNAGLNVEFGHHAIIASGNGTHHLLTLSVPNLDNIVQYTGNVPGQDLHTAEWLNKYGQKLSAGNSTIFNRNMYLAGSPGAIIRRGIDAYGSSGGVQVRRGGIVENNLYLRNPVAVTVGSCENGANTITSATVQDNVVLDSKNISTQWIGWGIVVSGTGSICYGSAPHPPVYTEGVAIERNILANHAHLSSGETRAIKFERAVDTYLVKDNITRNWGWNGALSFENTPWAANSHIEGNHFQTFHTPGRMVEFYGQNSNPNGFIGSGITFAHNQYYSILNQNQWFSGSGFQYGSFNAWQNNVEPTAGDIPVDYTDPDRNISRYHHEVLGKEPGFEAFIEEANKQSRFFWRSEYTACEVNNWIREGFDRDPIPCE